MTDSTAPDSTDDILTMATEIVAAYASRNQMASAELSDMIRSVFATLSGLASGDDGASEEAAAPSAPLVPAVPIDTSVGKDAITCLDCGKGFKTLKRHISTSHGMSPAEYRERWQLSKEYPLVASAYSKRRSATAKKIGLGRKPKAKRSVGLRRVR